MLTKELLIREYMYNGLSDQQIATKYGFARHTIGYARSKYGIPTRVKTGTVGEEIAERALTRNGFRVFNMNALDNLYIFDLLVNDRIRIDVKSAIDSDGSRWLFSLTNSSSLGIKTDNGYYSKLKNGRLKKDFSKTCDLLMFVGIKPLERIYIVPSKIIPWDQQSIAINIYGLSGKWAEWQERYDLINQLLPKNSLTKIEGGTSIEKDRSAKRP